MKFFSHFLFILYLFSHSIQTMENPKSEASHIEFLKHPAIREVFKVYCAFDLPEDGILISLKFTSKDAGSFVKEVLEERRKPHRALAFLSTHLYSPLNQNLPVFRDLAYGRSCLTYSHLMQEFHMEDARHKRPTKSISIFKQLESTLQTCTPEHAETLFQVFLPLLMTATQDPAPANLQSLHNTCVKRDFSQWLDFINIKLSKRRDETLGELMAIVQDARQHGAHDRQSLLALAPQVRRSLLTHGVDTSYVDHPMLETHVNFYTLAALLWNNDVDAVPHVFTISTFQYFLKSKAIGFLLKTNEHVDLIARQIAGQRNVNEAGDILYELTCINPRISLHTRIFSLMNVLATRNDIRFTPEKMKRYEALRQKLSHYTPAQP